MNDEVLIANPRARIPREMTENEVHWREDVEAQKRARRAIAEEMTQYIPTEVLEEVILARRQIEAATQRYRTAVQNAASEALKRM